MMGDLDIRKHSGRRSDGFRMYDSYEYVRERDRESVHVSNRRNTCIRKVVHECLAIYGEQCSYIGFQKVRVGIEFERFMGLKSQCIEEDEVYYSEIVENMIFTAEYPDGVKFWDPRRYAYTYKEWKYRRLLRISPMFRIN